MAAAPVLRGCAGRAGRRLGPWAAFSFLTLARLVSTAAAQDEDTLLTAPAGPYRGPVVDAQTARPIPDAVVVILWQRLDDQTAGVPRPGTPPAAFTDSQGDFLPAVRLV